MSMTMKTISMTLVVLAAALLADPATGADRAPASSSTEAGSLLSNRSKSLDFDNDVIEGMNKNPLDSLTRLGNKDDKQQDHLYRKKANFKREIRQSVQEMGYTQ